MSYYLILKRHCFSYYFMVKCVFDTDFKYIFPAKKFDSFSCKLNPHLSLEVLSSAWTHFINTYEYLNNNNSKKYPYIQNINNVHINFDLYVYVNIFFL